MQGPLDRGVLTELRHRLAMEQTLVHLATWRAVRRRRAGTAHEARFAKLPESPLQACPTGQMTLSSSGREHDDYAVARR